MNEDLIELRKWETTKDKKLLNCFAKIYHPTSEVTQYLDYSQKYGLVYITNENVIGINFNDCSAMFQNGLTSESTTFVDSNM